MASSLFNKSQPLVNSKRNNGLGNLVNYVDNGDAVDIKLYHTISDGSVLADLSYPFEFDSTIDTSKLIDVPKNNSNIATKFLYAF